VAVVQTSLTPQMPVPAGKERAWVGDSLRGHENFELFQALTHWESMAELISSYSHMTATEKEKRGTFVPIFFHFCSCHVDF
jgi:hypothetical protein